MQPLDAITLSHLAAELDVKLAGGKINKIQQPSFHELLLQLWVGGEAGREKLYINIQPQYAFCALIKDSSFLSFPDQAPSFCMLLRKHLTGARINQVSTLPNERVLNFALDNFNELGQSVQITLSIELMGKHSNIIVYDPEINMILGCAHGVSEEMSRHREVSTGYPYVPPPKANKPVITTAHESYVLAAIEEALKATEPEKHLTEQFSGVGSAVWRDIFNCTKNSKEAYRLFQDVKNGIHLYPAISKNKEHFSLLSCHVDDSNWEGASSINAMVSEFYTHQVMTDRFQQRRARLLQVLKNQEKKSKDRKKTLGKTDSAAMLALKKAGDLLTIAAGQNTPLYKNKIALEDYETGKPIDIEVDPALSCAVNAQAYYRRYKKAQAREQTAQIHYAELADLEAFISFVKNELSQAETMDDLTSAQEDMEAAGWLKPEAVKKGAVKKQITPMTTSSSDGFTILVGKNGLQNEQVSGKLAKPHDLWLHVQGMPGAHVLVRTEKKEVPDETLIEAAQLAVYYSPARNGVNVPVVYTEARYVRKIPGSYPGHVTYTHEKSVNVSALEN